MNAQFPPSDARILVVDDDPGQRSLLESFLGHHGFPVTLAGAGTEAMAVLRDTRVAMIISDVRMPGMSGLEMLRQIRPEHPTLPILLVTGFANIREAVGAIRDGALNYLSKPIDLDELLAIVRNVTGTFSPRLEDQDPVGELPGQVICRSPLMRAVFADAALVAPSDSRVLITGESGTGKEVVGDVIHAWSRRSSGPLVKINCAAIPENLLESELFGHEKGSFTGAYQQRTGRFEEAANGTIFLDEIGEMTPALQAKLLRITQDGCYRRVGSSRDLITNARILAVTNRDLEQEIVAGRFREDLFYRLNVLEINVPPLRERPAELHPLAAPFLTQFSQDKSRLSSAAADCLQAHSWPGNVRELRNAIERAALVSRGGVVLPEHLPNRVRATGSASSVTVASGPVPLDPRRLEEIERDAILRALKQNAYNRTTTARALAISRRALTYKLQRMRELGLPVDPVGGNPDP